MTDGVLIALDWGTTNVRAALLDKTGDVIDERRGDSGVGSLHQHQFGEHFDTLTSGWPDVAVIAAGMVGSRQGWREADYLELPATPQSLSGALTAFDHVGRAVRIVPGLKLDGDGRFDVMRGEETQIAGFLCMHPGWSGTMIMPGTHCKWVKVSDGAVVDFQTYMTGEIFDVMSKHTILRHSVPDDDAPADRFQKLVQKFAGSDRSIPGALFGLRAKHLLIGDNQDVLQELSAALVVLELTAGQTDGFDLSNGVVLIGARTLTVLYVEALKAIGVNSESVQGTSLVWPALFGLACQSQLIKGI